MFNGAAGAFAGMIVAAGLAACQTATTEPARPAYPPAFQQQAAGEAADRVMGVIARAVDEIAGYHITPVDEPELQRIAATYLVGGMDRGESSDQLVKGAVGAMLESLGGGNQVFDLEELHDPGSIRIAGVGLVEAETGDGDWRVINVHPEGPLGEAGVRPGWRLQSIDGAPRAGLAKQEVRKLLLGVDGSSVELGFLDSQGRTRNITAVRVAIARLSPVVATCADPAMLRILQFNARTAARVIIFMEACAPDRLVIDLRGNSGGLLEAVIDTAALFVGDAPQFILRTRADRTVRQKTGATRIYSMPVLLLTDRYTAAGAEIFADALRRHAGARIAGQNTFGANDIHTMEHLKDRLYMRLLTGRIENPDTAHPLAPLTPDHLIADDLDTDADEVLLALPQLAGMFGG